MNATVSTVDRQPTPAQPTLKLRPRHALWGAGVLLAVGALVWGERYWTVVDDSYRSVQGVDDWLLHLRIGRDGAQSTTESYAGSVALFFEWCASIGREWHTTAGEFGRFVYWLQHYDPDSAPGAVPRIVRGPRRVNVLAAVREYFRHTAVLGEVDESVINMLFDVVEDYNLPRDIRGGPQMRMRTKPRDRLSEPQCVVDAVSGDEVLAVLGACRNARDRFIVWRCGALGIAAAT